MEMALAARRTSRTRVEGAMKAVDVAIDARTGASIRGSSMAALVRESRGLQLLCDFSRCSVVRAVSAISNDYLYRLHSST